MNLFEQGDYYCERTDLTFWSEPMNAVTNLAFIIAALIMYRRLQGSNLVGGDVLVAILTAIGIGSFLFHTFATNWAALADVIPIGLFILVYLFLVARVFLEFPIWGALLATAAFVPYAYVLFPIVDSLPFFQISDFYWLVPILLCLVAPLVRRKNKVTAQGMVIGAVILCLSITLRSLDIDHCHHFPTGTHIFWHILNGIMLGWMIEVYRRHTLEPGRTSV